MGAGIFDILAVSIILIKSLNYSIIWSLLEKIKFEIYHKRYTFEKEEENTMPLSR